MVSVRRCQYENPNLPKYIVPYEDAAQLEHELIQCKRELAEAREELIEWRTLRSWGGTPQIVDDFIKGQQTRIHAAQDAEKQRDTLAEALEMIITHNLLDNQCDNGYPPRYVAKKALAAVKGGDA
jgi:phosphoribosylpyrophosphate synthetase